MVHFPGPLQLTVKAKAGVANLPSLRLDRVEVACSRGLRNMECNRLDNTPLLSPEAADSHTCTVAQSTCAKATQQHVCSSAGGPNVTRPDQMLSPPSSGRVTCLQKGPRAGESAALTRQDFLLPTARCDQESSLTRRKVSTRSRVRPMFCPSALYPEDTWPTIASMVYKICRMWDGDPYVQCDLTRTVLCNGRQLAFLLFRISRSCNRFPQSKTTS